MKASLQTSLDNALLAATEIYEPSCLRGTVEVNHATSRPLGKEMGEQNRAPPS